MGVDDFIYIGGGNASIPDRIRVNHDVGSMLTLVEAAGLIRPHLVFQPALCQLLLKNPLQLAFAAWIAATPWMSLRPLIDADKDMLLKLRHTDNVADFAGSVKATQSSIQAARRLRSRTLRPWLVSVRFVATVMPAL
jgi:hypothetical protein